MVDISAEVNFTEMKNLTYFCLVSRHKIKIQNNYLLNFFKTNQIIALVFTCILFILTVSLNGISVLTILKCRQLKSKVCYFLILIQSSTDLTVGVVSIPINIFVLARDVGGISQCTKYQILLNYISYLPLALSTFSLCAMTYERYMGVLFPLQHRTKVTKKKLLKFQCRCGLLTIIITAISLKYDIVYNVYSAIIMTVSVLFIAFAYIKIFITARKGTSLQHHDSNIVENTRTFNQKRRFLRELKKKSCFLVVVAFAFCYAPSVIILALMYGKQETTFFDVVASWCMILVMLNSSLNSLIFFWAKPVLRIEAAKAIKKIFSKML